jgi:hypothetical protein
MQVKLRILNETGHTELMVSESELIEQINDHPTHWISIDGEIVERKAINAIKMDSIQEVDLIPAIVGGMD